MTTRKLRSEWLLTAVAVLMLSGLSAEATEDSFFVEVDLNNKVVGSGGSGYSRGTWYYYPNTEWWNQWFYNAPYDAERMEEIEVSLKIGPANPKEPAYAELAYNWSTPGWSELGKQRPPLPDDIPNQNIEYKYIRRSTFRIVQLQARSSSIPVSHSHRIQDYNPEWVSIDVRGSNFKITGGWIKHECVSGDVVDQACCFGDGSCGNLLPDECLAKQGTPQGPNTDCANTTCPQPPQACCLPDGSCENLPPEQCNNQGGNPQGPNTDCSTTTCPQPLQACCLPNGTCIDVSVGSCIGQDGVPQGVGTNCNTVVCPGPEKPDLLITDISQSSGIICYQIANVGQATAPGGHHTALFVDGELVATDPVDPQLRPGESVRRCFDYDWKCTSQNDTITVCADCEDFLAEDSEINNCTEKVWHCEIPPLVCGRDVLVEDRITATSHQANPAIAVDDLGTLHVVWDDYRGHPQLSDIYYSKSTDGGQTWQEDVMVDVVITDTTHQCNPAIAVDDQGIIHVVWEDYRDSELGNIYYSNSRDGGKSFGEDVMVEDFYTVTSPQANPAIAVDNQGIIHVVWEDYRDSKLGNIYYSRSLDGGNTFERDVMVDDLVTDTSPQANPAIAADNQGIIHVVWEDYRDSELGDIYYSKSVNGGRSFEKDVMVDDAVTFASRQVNPAIAVDGKGVIHVVWEDYRDSKLGNIYYSKSLDGGNTFERDVMVDDEISVTTHQVEPVIAVDRQGIIHVAWEDYRDHLELGNVYYSRSTDGGTTFEKNVMVDAIYTVTTHQANPAIAADDRGTVHVVWEDYRDNRMLGNVYHSSCIAKPDLIITDVWSEAGIIHYQVRNIGGVVAPKGHETALYVEGQPVAKDVVDLELAAGERLNSSFLYEWQCLLPEDSIRVCADHEDFVDEDNEQNNCVEESWQCDTTAPKISDGPIVSKLTQTSCMISWTTDEQSNSTVKFSNRAGKYNYQRDDVRLTKKHEVALTDLKPSTVYHYIVQSSDLSANTTGSKDHTFETLPLPDERDPRVSIEDPGICKGVARIRAAASDNLGVARVEFYVEDKLISTAYSSPYECALDTTEYANGVYHLEAKAFDFAGRMAMTARVIEVGNRVPTFLGPFIEMVTPDHGETVSETVIVAARATDDEGMGRIEFYIDDDHVHTRVSPSAEWESLYSSFFWDTYEVANGPHNISVHAYDVEGNARQTTVTVTVDNIGPRHRPDLIVRRKNCTFAGTKVTIKLNVHNAGDRSAHNVEIVDRLVGLQPTGWVHSGWDLTSRFDRGTKECEVTLIASHPFNSGVGTDVLYDVVPILTEGEILYQVGTSTSVSYDGVEGDHYDKDLCIPSWVVDRPGGITWHLVATVDHAFSNSDYLIVTNPSRLLGHYVDDNVNALLCSMASLAEKRTGVLGYLDTYSHSVLMSLIEPGGGWSAELCSGWTSGGYLLIVGETEIVPSHSVCDSGIRNGTDHWPGGSVYPVPLVDNRYADISGSDNLPDLIVGRIVGNSANQLMTPIRSSLLDHFERTEALVISGIGGGQNKFENNADDVVGILDDEFAVNQMYGSDYATDGQRYAQFSLRAVDKDVIYYRDHGSSNCWSHTVCTWDAPLNFGTSYPLAFGNACSTGDFEETGDDHCAAEAFLESGAAVYIGATERSPRGPNNRAGKKFFNKWVGTSKSFGQAFKETKRSLGTSNKYKRLWVLEYNLYGDPKYGASAAVASSPTALAKETFVQPLSSLKVTVPNYQVTKVEGVDYVEIPGGELLLVPDKPAVPFYVASVDYPEGYQVQDVILTDRSGLATATGLNLSVVSMEQGENGSGGSESLAESTSSGWYPEQVYAWQIVENPDGSTTLLIMIYPFYYNSSTTDLEFYENYGFDIDYTFSTIQITDLTTDKDVYRQGENVLVNLWLNNSGEVQDVVVNATIRAEGAGELVDGLLLRSLSNLKGPASFSPQWQSDDTEPRHYYVEATLRDTGGNVLDRKTAMFRLGICSGKITSFSATPDHADIGDDVGIKMTFNNAGTVNITGVAVMRIFNSLGERLEEFRHDVANLIPSNSVGFSDIWNVPEAAPFTVVGHVLYDGKTTEPATVQINKPQCFPSEYSTYNDFLAYKALGKDPNCWCASYQCDGDADGSTELVLKYRVYGKDLGLIVENWKRTIDDPLLDPCADIDHKSELPVKYRVYGNDLSTVVKNWKKKDTDLAGDCPRPE